MLKCAVFAFDYKGKALFLSKHKHSLHSKENKVLTLQKKKSHIVLGIIFVFLEGKSKPKKLKQLRGGVRTLNINRNACLSGFS